MYQNKESKLEACTHFLDRAKDKLSGHKRKGASEGHSLARGGRGQDWSGHRKKSGPVRGTHNLERSEVGTGQDMERK